MLFTADVGNTNIVLSIFQKDKIIFDTRIATDRSLMADQYAVTILELLRLYGINLSDINGCIISSVVAPVTPQLKTALERMFSVKALVVGSGIKTGLNIKNDTPHLVGSDIICGAVAAKNIYPLPSIFIDLGTVTKIMVLDKYGALIGGSFFPGIKMSLDALAGQTAALPLVVADNAESPIGQNTADCMRAGVLFGTASMLDGMIYRIGNELSDNVSVVATGGFSELIKSYCRTEISLHPYLVSEGLRLIYHRNIDSN